nr:hypothetical protein [Pseudomonas sp. Root569]
MQTAPRTNFCHYSNGASPATGTANGEEYRFENDLERGETHVTDSLGRLIETRDPLGRSEHIRYLRHWALPVEVTDTAGRTYRSSYDAQGNLLWEEDPLVASTFTIGMTPAAASSKAITRTSQALHRTRSAVASPSSRVFHLH